MKKEQTGALDCVLESLDKKFLSKQEKINLIKSKFNLSHGKGKRKKKKH